MNRRNFYIAAAISTLAVSFFVVRKVKRKYVPDISIQSMPLKDLNGNKVRLDSFAGKALVVHFWGTWCGPCRSELPVYDKVQQKYSDRVQLVLVSDESMDLLNKFRGDNSYKFFYTQLQQPLNEMGLTSVPTTFFYDRQGKLVNKKKDPINESLLNELFHELAYE